MVYALLNNIFFAFVSHVYNTILFGTKKRNKVVFFLSWLIVILCFSIPSMSGFKNPFINMAVFVIAYIAITYYLYAQRLRRAVIYSLYFYLCGLICEIVPFYLISKFDIVNKFETIEFLMQPISNLIVFILVKILVLVMKTKQEYDLKLSNILEVFIIPVGSLYLLIHMCTVNISNVEIDIISITIILFINVVSYIFYSEMLDAVSIKYRADFLEKKNKDYIEESERISSLWRQISELQHNMKYMASFEQEKYNELFDATGFSKIVSRSGCIMIDAIINNRATIAEKENIKFDAKIKILQDVNYIYDDISIILYNLLDNAIEANEKVETGRFINIMIENDLRNENTLIIKIKNPYNGIIMQNSSGDYLTIKKERYAHGFGLRSVKQIVDKHNGMIKILHENNIFEVQIMLFNIDKTNEDYKI